MRNASSTIASSLSDAARWKTLKIFFQPDLILWAWELTIWAIHRTTMSRIDGNLNTSTKAKLRFNGFFRCNFNMRFEKHVYLFFFIMCSNGRRKSFWNRKLANSPFSMNFIDSWRRESTAKNAISSLGLHPTLLKCSPRT